METNHGKDDWPKWDDNSRDGGASGVFLDGKALTFGDLKNMISRNLAIESTKRWI